MVQRSTAVKARCCRVKHPGRVLLSPVSELYQGYLPREETQGFPECPLSHAGSIPAYSGTTKIPWEKMKLLVVYPRLRGNNLIGGAYPLSHAGVYPSREEEENSPLSPVSTGSLRNLFLVRPYDWSDPMTYPTL